MPNDEREQRHMEVYLAGFRSRGVAVGLVQLVAELRRTGALDRQGVSAIAEAIADEFTVTRPVGQQAEEFRARVKARIDHLLDKEGARDQGGLG